MSDRYVYPVLPRTGLANMLFLWGRASLYSKKYGAEMLAPNWFKPNRIGPILRREKYKRYYYKDFTNYKYLRGIKKSLVKFSVNKIGEDDLFDSWSGVLLVEGYGEYFLHLLGNNEYHYNELKDIVNNDIRSTVEREERNNRKTVGVHIRRGDFVKIGQDIPLGWYKNVCYRLLDIDSSLNIRVYSDADDGELDEIRDVPGLVIEKKSPAIQDLLVLANHDVLVGTSLSTFSLWASYLKLAPTIWSPISPGVNGYGLHTDNHIITDWDGVAVCDWKGNEFSGYKVFEDILR